MTKTVSNLASKATREVVEAVKRFAEVKSQIKALTAEKDDLDAVITEAFGANDLLIHHNVEVARRDWRSRSTFDEAAFKALLVEKYPELAETVLPLVEQSKKATLYSVIVNLYK